MYWCLTVNTKKYISGFSLRKKSFMFELKIYWKYWKYIYNFAITFVTMNCVTRIKYTFLRTNIGIWQRIVRRKKNCFSFLCHAIIDDNIRLFFPGSSSWRYRLYGQFMYEKSILYSVKVFYLFLLLENDNYLRNEFIFLKFAFSRESKLLKWSENDVPWQSLLLPLWKNFCELIVFDCI